MNKSSSNASFPFDFNDIISELEKRVIASQYPSFMGNDGIYGMMSGMIMPNYERSKGFMESFLLSLKEIAVETENNAIVKKIEKKVSTYVNIKEDNEFKTAGDFLYSVGGIARKALDVSNKIYDEYFKSYDDEFVKKHRSVAYIGSIAKDFPEYMKKFLNNEFFKNAYEQNKNNILKYVDQSDPNFSFELFHDLLNFYLRWNFSYPQLNITFLEDFKGAKFDNKSMADLILKGKQTKVNFCYLPYLVFSRTMIKSYVFTYMEGKTFIKGDINYENVKQINKF